MRSGEIGHMDVIANAGSIGGWIVVAENIDFFALSCRYFKHQRDQMCLRIVRFTKLAVFIRPRSVEISQRY